MFGCFLFLRFVHRRDAIMSLKELLVVVFFLYTYLYIFIFDINNALHFALQRLFKYL